MRIALLEDDLPQAELVRSWLERASHDCQVYERGKTLIRDLGRESFDLVILDWMLPDVEGIEVLRWIRQHQDWPIPVLFVTGKDSETDTVEALELGADDYMVKPVKRLELLARMKAVCRRSLPSEEGPRTLEFGRYLIDTATRTVYRDGEPVELTQKEFDLALFLFRGSGRVLSRGHILESVWGRSPTVNTRTVDTHVSRIRHKLALKPETGWQLRAVYQHGYRLEHLESLSPLHN